MSLINKLLKDLEKQETVDLPPPKLEPVHEELSLQPRHSHWWIWIVVIILALIVFLFYYYFLHGKPIKNGGAETGQLSAPQLAQKDELALEESKKAPKATEESIAHVQNIIFEAGDEVGETDVNVLLDTAVHYTVDLSNGGQQLLINLDNSALDLTKPLPEQIHNDTINSVKVTESQAEQQVKIVLNLQPNVELEQLDLLDKPKPRLKLVLFNPDVSAGTTTAATTPGAANVNVAQGGTETGIETGAVAGGEQEQTVATGTVRKEMVPLTSQQQLDRDYQSALNLIDKNETSTALNKLQALVIKYPDNLAIRESLASLLFSTGNKKQAEEVADVGLNINPTYSGLVKIKAHILVDQGNSKAALLLLEKAMPDINQDTDYYAFMANLYQTQGQSMAAARIYYQLVNLPDAKGIWWVGLGIALENTGKNNAALQAYQKAMRYPDLPASVRFYVEGKVQNRS